MNYSQLEEFVHAQPCKDTVSAPMTKYIMKQILTEETRVADFSGVVFILASSVPQDPEEIPQLFLESLGHGIS